MSISSEETKTIEYVVGAINRQCTSAIIKDEAFTIFAVTLAGTRRIADQSPGGLTLQSITPDGKGYIYSVRRYLMDLYLADGLR